MDEGHERTVVLGNEHLVFAFPVTVLDGDLEASNDVQYHLKVRI